MFKKYKRTFRFVSNTFFALLLILMIFLVISLVTSKISKDNIPKIGNYHLMVVLSGSMSPVFEAGDVVIVRADKKTPYNKGDVITFKDAEDAKKIITHRIMEVHKAGKQVSYRTKGDANDSPDKNLVPATNVIGQQTWRIPYLGRITEFSKTKQGFIWLIIVPGILIIVSELRNLAKIITDEVESKKQEVAGRPWSKE